MTEEALRESEHTRHMDSLSNAYTFLFRGTQTGTHKSYADTEVHPLTAEELSAHNIAVAMPQEGEPTNEVGQVLFHFYRNPDGTVSINILGSTRPKIFQGETEALREMIARENIQPWLMVDVPREHFQPPQRVTDTTVGMENELGVAPGGVVFSKNLQAIIAALDPFIRGGGKVTGEVVAEEIEANTAPCKASLDLIKDNFVRILNAILDSTKVGKESRVFVSSLNPYPAMGELPDDEYVRKFMGPFIARHMLNLVPEIIDYINLYGKECMIDGYNLARGRELGTPITQKELEEEGNTAIDELRIKIVEWFSAMAIHNHVQMPAQVGDKEKGTIEIRDDNSSTFVMNAIAYGSGQIRNALSLSSFALNGHLLTNEDGTRLHDGKRRHRNIFTTARYQHPVRTVKNAFPHIVESISNHSPSITRALTGNDPANESWHGAHRKRGELGTIELLTYDSMTSVELAASLSMADALDSFLLAYLYKEGRLERYGISMEEVRRFYCLPEGWRPAYGSFEVDFEQSELEGLKNRYEANRFELQARGVGGQYIAPDGTVTTYRDHLIEHRNFVRRFFQSFNEVTATQAVDIMELIEIDKWLICATDTPSTASIEAYHDPNNVDYMRGNMGYHLWNECNRLIEEILQYGSCGYQFNDGRFITFKPEDPALFKENSKRGYYPELISWYMDNIVGPVQRRYLSRMSNNHTNAVV